MSLIHDALKSMDAPQPAQPVQATPVAPVVAAGRGRPAWVDGLLAFCVVVGAGAAGWYVWQGQKRPHLDSAAAVRSVNVAPQAALAPATPPAALAMAQPADAGVSNPPAADAAAAPVQPAAASAAVAAPATPPAAPAAQKPAEAAGSQAVPQAHAALPAKQVTAHRQPRRERPVAVAKAAAPEPKVVDDTPVEAHFARFVTAMRAENTADAERELAVLKQRLPGHALGLVRAQAWFDLKSGNDAAAANGYREILDRIPGDEEAAINLASIQGRQSKHEEARSTLDAAARLRPDSAALKAALAQYTPNVRK